VTSACITLSDRGAAVASRIMAGAPEMELYVHESVPAHWGGRRFSRIAAVTQELFSHCSGLVYVAPCGVVVRSIAPCVRHKTTDPAVVVIDVGGRFAISLLGGHEAGANDLALRVANIIHAEPVITTTSEASESLRLFMTRLKKSAGILPMCGLSPPPT
jgi:cobalt-precorrin 5A hydrolase